LTNTRREKALKVESVLEKEGIINIYSRYSNVYDLIFSHMFTPRIRLGLEKMGIKEGDLIIEEEQDGFRGEKRGFWRR